MNETEFRNLYLCEPTPIKLPDDGFKYVLCAKEAREKAREYGLSPERWRYISRDEQIQGVELPNRDKFYFINLDVDRILIETRIRK